MKKSFKKKAQESNEPKAITSYTIKLDESQMEKLEAWCDNRGWKFTDVPYSRFGFKKPEGDVNLVAYTSGKLVVQGKGTEVFVQDVIEAEITMDPQLGYEEIHHPEWFEAHAGLDEAGKGDIFGPLVVCTVIADGEAVRIWREKKIRDSKTMNDTSAVRLAKEVRKTKGVVVEVLAPSMERYNEMMSRPKANLNLLLAWMHAKALEKALAKKKVKWGMLDQFSKQPLTQRYLDKDKIGSFDLRMQTKAESDPIVAAASIVARAEFVTRIADLSKALGVELPKGASTKTQKLIADLAAKHGKSILPTIAKTHFKPVAAVLNGAGS